MTHTPSVVDVLVIGAGPTGLTMACELRRHGLSCRIVDQAESPSGIPKAVAVQSRTLEVFDIMGLDREFVAQGHQVHGVNVYGGGQRLAHVVLDELPTRYAYMLTLPQSETERLLAARLSSLRGHVEWSVQLTGLAQQEGGISATLRHPDGKTETQRARWLVGCDGAHSAVRKAVGLSFEGARYEESFLLAYVRLESGLPTDEAHAFFTPDGPVAMLPLPRGRHYVILPLFKDSAEADRTTVSLDELKTVLAQRGKADLRILEAFWITKFRVHRRMVPSLRVGPVFLCGDASHIHSPVGGQGMNLGIQDAFNLAWKLALVTTGAARPTLLDSYHAERHPIASETLVGTDLATRVVTLRSPLAQAVRNQVALFLSSLEVVQHRLRQTVAGLLRNYRKSPIVAEHGRGIVSTRQGFGAACRAGDRVPDSTFSRTRPDPRDSVRLYELLRAKRHQLLLFGGGGEIVTGVRGNLAEIGAQVRNRYRELVDVHLVIPRAARLDPSHWDGSILVDTQGDLYRLWASEGESLYLIRPDGYLGYRSQPADSARLFSYLEMIFIAPGSGRLKGRRE